VIVFEGRVRVEVCHCSYCEARSHNDWAALFWMPSVMSWPSAE